MNVVDLEHRLIGCFGIVGGSLAAATGAGARPQKRRRRRRRGLLRRRHRQPGLLPRVPELRARCCRLPVVFVCENNLLRRVHPDGAGHRRAASSPAPAGARHRRRPRRRPGRVGGARRGGERAVERARAGDGPVFIEAVTYRFADHGGRPRQATAGARRAGALARARPARRRGARGSWTSSASTATDLERDRGTTSRPSVDAGHRARRSRRRYPEPDRARRRVRRLGRWRRVDFRAASGRRSTRSSSATRT